MVDHGTFDEKIDDLSKFCIYSYAIKDVLESPCSNPDRFKFLDAYDHPSEASQWRESIEDEFASMVHNQVWQVIEKPSDLSNNNIVGNRWVFRYKHRPDGSIARFKSRLVARGFTQTKGVNYYETFAPVARYNSIRTVLALTSKHGWLVHQMDVKTAFLCADIDVPLYMTIPEGFDKIQSNPDRDLSTFKSPILKLLKGIYGIKQAPRLWNRNFTEYLRSQGFSRSEYDHSVYFRNNIIIVIYVDDFLLAANSLKTINSVKSDLSQRFQMVDLGEAQHFLNTQIIRSGKGYGLSQKHYIRQLLEEFNMTDVKDIETPMESGATFSKRVPDRNSLPECALPAPVLKGSTKPDPDSGQPADKSRYLSLVGSLLYINMCTRPDIGFALSHLSQFAADPSTTHWKALKRILRYLKSTQNFVLWLDGRAQQPTIDEAYDPEAPNMQIFGFSDADWAADKNDRRSVGAYQFFVEKSLVSWCCKKQAFVATSSMESEYMSASAATKEAVWLQNFVHELSFHALSSNTGRPPVILFMDNKAAIRVAKNPEFYARSKHIDICYHFIRQRVELRHIQIHYKKTSAMLADFLTKALPSAKFIYCRDNSGITENDTEKDTDLAEEEEIREL